MCCFSRPVSEVSRTRIFAREWRGRELLAYDMRLASAEDVAMILPVPVPLRSPERTVEFFDLSGYPRLFDDLERGFPASKSRGPAPQALATAQTLPVQEVGAFVASFVPHQDDFARLDPRFRIAPEVWSQLPQHRDSGFVVFQLRATGGTPAAVHPMAFMFPLRNPRALFFPTVHVHDGAVHAEARFDHVLYYQSSSPRAAQGGLKLAAPACSLQPAGAFVDIVRARGVVDGASPVWRRRLSGKLPNIDVVLI